MYLARLLKRPQLSVTNDVSIDQQGRLLFSHKTRKGPRGVILLLRYTLFIYHILIYINYILHTLYITYLYTLIIYYILYANKKTTSSPRKRTCQKQDKRKALPFLAALLFNSLIKSLRKGKALLSYKF